MAYDTPNVIQETKQTSRESFLNELAPWGNVSGVFLKVGFAVVVVVVLGSDLG